MTPLSDAQAHLRKAEEFLLTAEVALEGGLHDAAASNAVLAGINAKDAMCLRLTGRTGKTQNHQEAVRELKNAGPSAALYVTNLQRLLPRSGEGPPSHLRRPADPPRPSTGQGGCHGHQHH